MNSSQRFVHGDVSHTQQCSLMHVYILCSYNLRDSFSLLTATRADVNAARMEAGLARLDLNSVMVHLERGTAQLNWLWKSNSAWHDTTQHGQKSWKTNAYRPRVHSKGAAENAAICMVACRCTEAWFHFNLYFCATNVLKCTTSTNHFQSELRKYFGNSEFNSMVSASFKIYNYLDHYYEIVRTMHKSAVTVWRPQGLALALSKQPWTETSTLSPVECHRKPLQHKCFL